MGKMLYKDPIYTLWLFVCNGCIGGGHSGDIYLGMLIPEESGRGEARGCEETTDECWWCAVL